jgi:hypothetical protein
VRAKVKARYPTIGKKQIGAVVPRGGIAPRRNPLLGGGAPRPPRPFRPAAPAAPRIPSRLGAEAGFRKGGVVHGAAAHRPHTYGAHKGGGRSGDPHPATIGKMSGHGGFASHGIRH